MTENAMLAAIEAMSDEARNLDAPLNDRLAYVADRVRALTADFADAVDRLIARLQDAGAGAAAPRVGEPMPDFALPDETGRIVTLRSVIAGGPAAISFNRGHWCPYCRLHVAAMAEVQAEVAALGGTLVAIVPERRKFAAALKAAARAPFPVLTDMDNGYALSLNLAIWVGAELAAMIAGTGIDVPEYQGNSAWLLPIPATFVVRPDGIIAARHIEPDYRRRMEIGALVDAVKLARSAQNPAIPRRAAD